MPVEIKEKHPLNQYHTFGLHVHANHFAEVFEEPQIVELLQLDFSPVLVLGGGSNLYFVDDFPGLIIKNSIYGIQIKDQSEDSVVLKIGGGVVWHDLVLWTIEHDFGGLENLSLIPGTVGAAPIQNIGAYGVEFDSVFVQLEAINLASGEKSVFTKSDCDFGYRDSIFKRALKGQFIVVAVEIKLTRKNHKLSLDYGEIKKTLHEKGISDPGIKDVSDAVIAIRSSKLPDPAVLGNAGSFFKNPVIPSVIYERLLADYPDLPGYPVGEGFRKIPAAWLIESAGWKGYRKNDAGVYAKHALVLVNYGTATGVEMHQLAVAIQNSIFEIFGIHLETEVNMI